MPNPGDVIVTTINCPACCPSSSSSSSRHVYNCAEFASVSTVYVAFSGAPYLGSITSFTLPKVSVILPIIWRRTGFTAGVGYQVTVSTCEGLAGRVRFSWTDDSDIHCLNVAVDAVNGVTLTCGTRTITLTW